MSEQKLGVMCYLPPRRVYPAVDSFLQNIKDFPPKHPLILFSDEDYGPGVLKLGGSVEVAKTETNKMGVNNLIFFTACRIAASHGFSHIVLLENDTRVMAEGWDDIIFREFFRKNPNADAGGSIVIFNPCSYTRDAAEKYHKFLKDTDATRPMPISMTGSSNLAEQRDSCVFPNGAFAVYSMSWLLKTFPEIVGTPQQYIEMSQKVRTWDYEIGIRLWNQYKESVYDHIVQIDSVYSGYGNIMSTEEERRNMLTSGKVIGIHQIKSDWKPEKNQVPSPIPVTQKVEGNTSIFIVTYSRDFEYLKYCLRSIQKFSSGFSDVTILVPQQDAAALREIVRINYSGSIPVRIKYGVEWSGKGMVWHLCQEMRADEWALKSTDYIAHFDSDVIFTKPVSPETFFHEGKPILRYEPFSTLALRHSGTLNWKIAAENALPFQVNNEYMRGFPHIYHRSVYQKTRDLVEQKTKMKFNDFVRSSRNEYPQQVCEYVTLGAVAHHHFSSDYHFIDLSKTPNPDRSPYPVQQFWSHGSPSEPQEIWVNGQKQNIVPIEFIEKALT